MSGHIFDSSFDNQRVYPDKVSSGSKVNFCKLNEEEKLQRFRSMANEIRKLRAEVRNLKKYKSKKIQKAHQGTLPQFSDF